MTDKQNSGVQRSLRLLTVSDVEALADLEWLVRGMLPRPSLTILYGEPGCGKTFVALSMALIVVSGGEWLGRETAPASVLYIAAEGVLGLKSRIAAHRKKFGVPGEAIRFLAAAPNLLDEAQVDNLIACVEAADFRPSLIIVDTLG